MSKKGTSEKKLTVNNLIRSIIQVGVGTNVRRILSTELHTP